METSLINYCFVCRTQWDSSDEYLDHMRTHDRAEVAGNFWAHQDVVRHFYAEMEAKSIIEPAIGMAH